MRTIVVSSLVGCLLVGSAASLPAQEVKAWVHVQVADEARDEARVNVNLPLAAVEAALALAPNTVVADGRVRLGDDGISVSALRQVWQAVRASGDAELVTVDERDKHIGIVRRGETIEVTVDEDGTDERVRAFVPVALVDALLSGDDESLNVRAAIERLQGLRGDIVRVEDGTKRIRVWVDEAP